MKIDRIQARNWIGAREVDIQSKTPAILIAGDNDAGKSSLFEGIRAALTGEVSRVKLKGDYPSLVTEGPAKEGTIAMATNLGDASFSIPKGNHGFALNMEGIRKDSMPCVLDASAFAKMDTKEKRAFVFKLSGCSAAPGEIVDRLLAKGIHKEIVGQITSELPHGMSAASKVAAANATLAKGAWQQITGAKWGPKVGESWKPDLPEFDEDDYKRITDGIRDLKVEIDEYNELMGSIKEKIKAGQSASETIKTKQNNVAMKGEIQAKLAKAEEAYEAAVAAAKKAFQAVEKSGNKSPDPETSNGLPYMLLRSANAVIDEVLQLAARTQGVISEDEEIQSWEEFDWIPKAESFRKSYKTGFASHSVDPELQKAASDAEKKVNDCEGVVTRLEARLKEIGADEKFLEESGATDSHDELMEQLKDTQNKIRVRKDSLVGIEAQTEEMNALAKEIEESGEKEKAALKKHEEVLAWDACAKALGPDGIPGDIVAEALGPFNKSLYEAHELSGWDLVQLRPDMSLFVGGRPYDLLSESGRWRADASISVAVSVLSKIRFLILDRIDVLSPVNRGVLLGLVDDLIYNEIIDGAVLFGTLKAKPADDALPESFSCYWLDQGKLSK